MTENSTGISTETVRLYAEKQLGFLQTVFSNIVDEHSASYRWLMASLLALNGGAIVALKEQIHFTSWLSIIPVFLFYLGITGALMLAWLGQKSIQKSLVPISNLIGYWMAVSATGETDDEKHSKFQQRLNESKKAGLLPAIAGWSSFIFFSLGMVAAVAIYMNESPFSNAPHIDAKGKKAPAYQQNNHDR